MSRRHEDKFSFSNIFRWSSLAATVVLAVLALGTAAAQAPELSNDERSAVLTLHALGQAVEAHKQAHGTYPGPVNEMVPASQLQEILVPVDASPLVFEDPWGRPIVYWTDGVNYALGSYGTDGAPDNDFDNPVAEQTTIDDLVWANGDLVKRPDRISQAMVAGTQKRSMADMRSIGICFEAFRVDNGSIPGPTEGFVPVETFRGDFQPVYIRSLPLNDGWGNPILVWTDGVESYRIVSTGEDGIRESDYEDARLARRPDSPAADIVIIDGYFVQWPLGIAQ